MPESTDENLSIEDLRRLADVTEDPEKKAAIERTIIERSNVLVMQWMRYAYKFAESYYRYFPGSEDDVNQAALLGMTEASRKFDDAKGKFHNIAAWHMLKQLQRMHATSGKLVRHAKNPRYRPSVVIREIERMQSEGLRPDFDVACDRLGIPVVHRGALREAWELKQKEYEVILSCNEPFHDEDPTMSDVLDRERSELLRSSLDRLPKIVKEVLLDYASGVFQSDTSERLDICRPSVLRYRTLGIRWMKYYMGEGPKPIHPLIVKEMPSTGTIVPTLPENLHHAKAL